MKNGTRFAALGGVVVAGALALSACGSDSNGTVAGPLIELSAPLP